MTYVLAGVIGLVISFLLVPTIGRFATKIGFVDRPTKRKTHDRPIPMLVSIGIFIAFFVSYFIFTDTIDKKDIAIFITSTIILVIGIIDDWYKTRSCEFASMPRLLSYLLCSIIVYLFGIRFVGMNLFWLDTFVVFPQWLQFMLTVLWIMGVTIIINWMDGLDGLSGGISVIAATTFFIVALVKDQANSALMAIILIGSILGYLRYNMPPAKVYMSDSGATFIGFILAIISLEGAFKQVTVFSVCIPLLALGVPIFDNLRVVIKRFLAGSKLDAADKSQLHHQLINSGMNVKQVNALLYLSSTCLCLLSIIILILNV